MMLQRLRKIENPGAALLRAVLALAVLASPVAVIGPVRAGNEVVSVPGVEAPSYVLIDYETGRVLAGKDFASRRYPASTTKTMTALLAVESGKLDQTVTIGPNPPKTGEQSANLLQGETFLLHDLVEAALIKSANDSCVAIAEGVAGTEAKFVEMMNKRAREAGATHTHFMNPHGLHHPNHYTTAYDLALIARAALRYPVYNEIIFTKEARIHGNAQLGATRLLVNKNKLLFRWSLCDGVKTGYTKQAGRCLVGSATRVDPQTGRRWRLVSVVLHAPDSWTDSRNLLEYGFKKFTPNVMAKAGEELATLDVQGGATQVNAVASEEIALPLLSGERARLSTRIHSLEPRAPVGKNQMVATMEWSLDGKKIGSTPLVAREAVGKSLPVKLVPAAAQVVPSVPWMRWGIYACALLGMTCIFAGWKMRADERKREYRRPSRGSSGRTSG